MHVRNRFLSVRYPKHSTAEGLFECFQKVVSHVGIVDWEDKLVGFECNGA